MLLYLALSLWMFFLLIYALNYMPTPSGVELARLRRPRSSHVKLSVFLGFATLFLCWFLTAFRAKTIGNDTRAYIQIFKYIASYDVNPYSRYEAGYQRMNYLIGKITDNPHMFLILTASIMYGGLAIYLKKYAKNLLLSVVLSYCLLFSAFTNIIRQGIAGIIVLFAYQSIKEQKRIKAFLLILLASSFHRSAIVTCLLFFSNKLVFKRTLIYPLVAISVAVSQTGIPTLLIAVLFPSYAHYQSSRYASTGWLAITYNLMQNLALYHSAQKAADIRKPEDRLCLWNFVLSMFCISLGFSINLFSRISQYFVMIAVVEYPNIFCENRCRHAKLYLFLVCCMFIVMFLVTLILRPNWNYLYPYEFWSE